MSDRRTTCADMSPEPALMTRRWNDRDQALSLAKTIHSWASPVSTQDIGPCTGSASNPCLVLGSGKVTREWHGDRSSNTEGDYSDPDSDPEPASGTTAVPSPANVSALSVPSAFVWASPFQHAGTYKQTCPACSKPFGCGLGVRSDCTDRGRRYVIMSHSQGTSIESIESIEVLKVRIEV